MGGWLWFNAGCYLAPDDASSIECVSGAMEHHP